MPSFNKYFKILLDIFINFLYTNYNNKLLERQKLKEKYIRNIIKPSIKINCNCSTINNIQFFRL